MCQAHKKPVVPMHDNIQEPWPSYKNPGKHVTEFYSK